MQITTETITVNTTVPFNYKIHRVEEHDRSYVIGTCHYRGRLQATVVPDDNCQSATQVVELLQSRVESMVNQNLRDHPEWRG